MKENYSTGHSAASGARKPIHIGRATELLGYDRYLYRFFEMIPGLLAWGTIIGCFVFSWIAPVYVALFIITFDLYWLLKTAYLSIYLRRNWRRMKESLATDWNARLASLKYERVYHLVLLPFYKEGDEVVEKCLESLKNSKYDLKKFLVVLGIEERAGNEAKKISEKMQAKFDSVFGAVLVSIHLKDIPGEMAGKGSNITYMVKQAKEKILDIRGIPYGDVIVSAFDIDTNVYPQYFSCVAWYFLTSPRPYRTSFQPVPLYNNNIWDAPALSRVVAMSGTFWQMIQQERPEKLATFSSHSVPFQTLNEIGFWQVNMVSEDSRIFWNALMAYDGDYTVTPISYPVSMDANLAPTLWQTAINVYKQQRRWGWGVENMPYLFFGFVKNKRIPLWQKIKVAFVQLEGYWSLATNPIIIFMLGWLPLWFGGAKFNTTILSYNLPIFTRSLMILAMAGLVVSAIISFNLIPKRPSSKSRANFLIMILQWILIPITITIFGSIPGLEAQTRLMFGRYMGFWVTPKHQKLKA